MIETICGANCAECFRKEACKGCVETVGRPFGGTCLAAEIIKQGGMKAFAEYKQKTISEIKALNIPGMAEIDELHCLCGSFVNLAYPLPNGAGVQFLKDEDVYLGTQVELAAAGHANGARCYGIVAGMDFIVVAEYGCEGAEPELVAYIRR